MPGLGAAEDLRQLMLTSFPMSLQVILISFRLRLLASEKVPILASGCNEQRSGAHNCNALSVLAGQMAVQCQQGTLRIILPRVDKTLQLYNTLDI